MQNEISTGKQFHLSGIYRLSTTALPAGGMGWKYFILSKAFRYTVAF